MGTKIVVGSDGLTAIFVNRYKNNTMSQRRMFSPDIICSEEFLDMPPTCRDLYTQLAIRADDDGFIQPKSIMRILGSAPDDLKILLAKRFLLTFESGVVVIKHWLIHNMIRKDRYKETRFLEEKGTLKIKDNNAYTELQKEEWQPNGNQMAPQVRLDNTSEPKDSQKKDIDRVIEIFKEVSPSLSYGNKTQRNASKGMLDKWPLEKLEPMIYRVLEVQKDKFAPRATTPHAMWTKIADLASYINSGKNVINKVAKV